MTKIESADGMTKIEGADSMSESKDMAVKNNQCKAQKSDVLHSQVDQYRKKQLWIYIAMAAANGIAVAALALYYALRQSALIGQLYLENGLNNKNQMDQFLSTLFHLNISADNIGAAETALKSSGYTEHGMFYLFRISGELYVLIGIAVLIAVLLIIGIRHCYRLGKKDLLGQLTDLSEYSDQLAAELEQERIYNQEQKKTLRDFMENIAHQVKTPLTALTVKLEVLQLHSDCTDVIDGCFENIFKIKEFISRLLNISRLEAGKVIMAGDELAIEDVLEESILESGVDQERIHTCYGTYGKRIYADENWLKEAFINLISNSMEYANEGSSGEVYIHCEDNSDHIVITISDNGRGITQTQLDSIFNRFESSQDAGAFHAGIGLNLAKLIIEAHHGKIHAGNSEEYGGAEFRVILPVYEWKQKI